MLRINKICCITKLKIKFRFRFLSVIFPPPVGRPEVSGQPKYGLVIYLDKGELSKLFLHRRGGGGPPAAIVSNYQPQPFHQLNY